MGGSSSSTTENTSYNFNNMGNASGGLAGNINQGEGANLEIGDVIETDHGATVEAGKTSRKALQTGEKAISGGMKLTDRMNERAMEDAGEARETAEMMLKTTSGTISDANRRTLQQMQQSNDRAMAFANKASRSDTSDLAKNMTRYGAFAVGGLALAIIMANRG